MKKIILPLLLATAFNAQADTNVALNAAVTLNGTYGGDQGPIWGNYPLAAPGSITDGSPLADGTQWNIGTVFWNDFSNTIDINLGGIFQINSLVVQADNNDAYQVSYLNGGSWDIIGVAALASSWGLQTGNVSLGSPIFTSEFRIQAIGGDGYSSLGQFSAFGSAVPEPEQWTMLLAGIAMLAAMRNRNAV